jgi:anthranilate phosphoribosyltransferase
MLQETLKQLFNHQTLSREQARNILVNISKDAYQKSEVVAFITAFMMRPITVDELSGFKDALLELCIPIDLSDFNAIDMCGTGGDGKNTFNISTLASFVVAGAGSKVAKHGNYGVSSSCGSSNVMEFFGYQFTNNADRLKQQIDQAGICFLHAPLFHPAMKSVAPIRKELRLKTFFNMLGPLVNPSFPPNQLVGVYSLELARLYQYILQNTEKKYTILHALDGYDEISLTGDFKTINNSGEQLLTPNDLNMSTLNESQLHGGTSIKEAADIFASILDNKGTEAQNNVVIANAAMALNCMEPQQSLDHHVAIARNSLESGKAKASFLKIMELSK